MRVERTTPEYGRLRPFGKKFMRARPPLCMHAIKGRLLGPEFKDGCKLGS